MTKFRYDSSHLSSLTSKSVRSTTSFSIETPLLSARRFAFSSPTDDESTRPTAKWPSLAKETALRPRPPKAQNLRLWRKISCLRCKKTDPSFDAMRESGVSRRHHDRSFSRICSSWAQCCYFIWHYLEPRHQPTIFSATKWCDCSRIVQRMDALVVVKDKVAGSNTRWLCLNISVAWRWFSTIWLSNGHDPENKA